MSASVAPAATAPTGRRRLRTWLLLGGGLVVAVAVVVAAGGGTRTGTPYDPDNPGPDGAQAVARVLEDNGVDVVVARNAAELEQTTVDAATTVLVTQPDLLGESTTDALLAHAGAGRLVVAGAEPGVVDALGLSSVPSRVPVGEGRDASCTDRSLGRLLEGLEVEVDSSLAYPGAGCFPGEHGALVVEPRRGLVLLGAEDALTNDQVLRADNAALALRLLGQDRRLVWYVPALTDLGAEDGVSLATLIPRWVRPGLFLLTLTALALLLWRGRRLGPLAVEPLPVVVRAIETTRSRGRLYRKAGDRAHAAGTLRAAARASAAEALRLGPDAPAPEVIRAVARVLSRPEREVGVLLDPHAEPPGTDADLVHLATKLAELEREVRPR